MRHILMILALCAAATAPRADTQLTPWLFDLRKQFDDCIKTPSDNPYNTCQEVLISSFTLRRELAYALDDCRTANVEGCKSAFKNAGFPADSLHIATLENCVMLDSLNDVDIREIPAGSCIEHLARLIETRGIPTSHNTDTSCGINYIECAEIVDKGTEYWEATVWALFYEKLHAIPESSGFTNDISTSHRYYSLLEQKQKLQIDLAETNCHLLTVIPHWANPMDYRGCMGEAYMQMWLQMKAE